MITRLGMAPRLERMTYEQFQHHWRTAHADAAGKIPNLKRYVQNHAVLRDGAPIFGFLGSMHAPNWTLSQSMRWKKDSLLPST